MGLFAELRRRNVVRVAIAYAVIAWLLAQVADLAFDNFGAPDWVPKTFMFLLLLGLPLAIFFAWAFELTPAGIKKESDVDRSQSITNRTGRKLDFVIIGVLVVAVGFLVADKFMPTNTVQTGDEIVATSVKPSIAVLPFENRSNREEDQFFTDGIHDDLLTTIANIGSLKVISRTSVMEYRETTKKIREIAAELGVANILEGGIQRSGNKVRINVQLIDAATDEHLWAEIYDRELTAENLFAIQSEVSNAIATALQTALSPEEASKINAVPTRNLEAYEAYLIGREKWRKRTAASVAESLGLFQKAVDLDPEFALAWVGLSDAYRFQFFYGGKSRDDMLPKSEAAARHALQLDDELGPAYAALGNLHLLNLDYKKAEAVLSRAIKLDRNYLTAYNWYSLTLQRLGQHAEAEDIVRQGLELDPLSMVLNSRFARLLERAGKFAEALVRYERMIEIDPDSWLGYLGKANYYFFVTGELDKAQVWLRKTMVADPKQPNFIYTLARLFLNLGDPDAAALRLDEALELGPETDFSRLVRGMHALATGDKATAQTEMRLLLVSSPPPQTRSFAMRVLAELDPAGTDIAQALSDFVVEFPDYADTDALAIVNSNFETAVNLAALLIETGKEQEAQRLLDSALAYTDTAQILGVSGYGFGRAEIYALRGDKQQAHAELASAVDAGVRAEWWIVFDYSPVFKALRDDPEFQTLRARVAADMAEQLANINKKETQSFVN